jgi:GNAT superfamily N-acetyltransferase
MPVEIRSIEAGDADRVRAFLEAHNGPLRVVSRGLLHDLRTLPGFLAENDRELAGVLTYRTMRAPPAARGLETVLGPLELEVVTLNAVPPGRGTGSRLLAHAIAHARSIGCSRLWLITTNDNDPAIRFYDRRGMVRVAVYAGAIRNSRAIKPEIPLTGVGGQPIEDEIEYEVRVSEP